MPELGQTIRALGGLIEVRVEVDTGAAAGGNAQWDISLWGIDTWGSEDADWFDISAYVLSVNTQAGSEKWGDRFQTGTASIVVDNTLGLFTPESGVAVPWALPWRPGRRIRVVALPDPNDDSIKAPLWTGYVEATNDSYDDAGFNISTTIVCGDNLSRLAAANLPALTVATGVQSTSDRVTEALDRIAWPAPLRDIQAGDHTMQSSFIAQPILEECARAADAEGGAFFCGADGSMCFRARDWLTTDTRSIVVQGWLGYDEIPTGGNTAHVLEVRTSWETNRIANLVRLARSGSTVQEVEDADSQATYGPEPRTHERLDYENNSDAEVLVLAERILKVRKDSRVRVDSVRITGNADPGDDDLNRMLYDTQIGDLLSVLVEPPYDWSYERLVQVMGISHRITADDWEVELKLDDALINFLGGRELLMGILEPLAWWRFDEPSGTSTADDATPGGHTLTWVGAPTLGVAGPIAGGDVAVSPDGVNDAATSALEAELELRQDMSLEMWFRPHDAAGSDQAIISCRGFNDPLFEFFYNPDNDRVMFYPYSGAGIGITAAEPVLVNVWCHLVVTFEWLATSRRVRFYRDGTLLSTATMSYLPPATARVLNVGRRANTNDLYFDGDITELTIWDRVLSDLEIVDLATADYIV